MSKERHDINNILTSLNMVIEIMLREMAGPVTPQQKKHLKGMLSDVKKIAELLKKIKD